VPDAHGRPLRARISTEHFERAVNAAERALQRRIDLWSDTPPESMSLGEMRQLLLRSLNSAITTARIARNKLTTEQWEDPATADLRRRLDEVERLQRTGQNPLGELQERIQRALDRLAQEPDSPLTREIKQILTQENR